jgi:hypothetical protein
MKCTYNYFMGSKFRSLEARIIVLSFQMFLDWGKEGKSKLYLQ